MFVAHGPSFKKNTHVRSFHNIDLYNMMCGMMQVEPLPNNGTWVSTMKILRCSIMRSVFSLISNLIYCRELYTIC